MNNSHSSTQKTGSVLTIGNFDGCHIGHQKLLDLVKSKADSLNLRSIVLSFEPTPKEYFSGKKFKKLFSSQQKLRFFQEIGIDEAILIPFDEEFSKQSCEEFFQSHLVDRFQVQHLVVGADFCFGHNRQGNANHIAQLCQEASMGCSIVDDYCLEKERVHSSRIREALAEGDVQLAEALLGRPYLFEGTIVEGAGLGRNLGYPTANLHSDSQMLPTPGVYAAFVTIKNPAAFSLDKNTVWKAIVNCGYAPTLQNRESPVLEVHILEPSIKAEVIYGQKLSCYFMDFVRLEKKFADKIQLIEQIALDIDKVQASLDR